MIVIKKDYKAIEIHQLERDIAIIQRVVDIQREIYTPRQIELLENKIKSWKAKKDKITQSHQIGEGGL